MTTSSRQSRWTTGPAIVLYIAATKLFVQLLVAGRYGIFRDEMYYLACAEHLDWGYVDQPPLIALIGWFARGVFGSSLLGLRFLPALAGAGLVWLTGKLAREMGGGRFAQGFAAFAVLASPIFLLFHHWLTMNAFEPLIWMGAALCVARAINTGRPTYWLWFGVVIGVGMQTKYSVAFFAFGIVAGLILTRHRRFLRSKWIWLGAIAAFLIFLPNLIWLIRHDFPFLELMNNIRHSGRDVARGPLAFVLDQGMIMNPILFPLWFAGLAWLFFGKPKAGATGTVPDAQSRKYTKSEPGAVATGSLPITRGRYLINQNRYAIFAWAYLVMLVTFIVLKGKNYYLAPAYPTLFAAGAVAFEQLTRRVTERVRRFGRLHWLRHAYTVAIILAGLALTPLTIPVLSPEAYIRYQRALGFEPPKTENQNTGPLPQHFADEFGWEDMTREVAKVYHSLPAEERAQTAIFANSYGQAGAIDFFGPRYGLPEAISNHQNYWYWGPGNYSGSTVIVLGSDGDGDREHFASVQEAAHIYHPYSRRDEHFPILLCRGLNQNLKTLWPTIKKWN
ncbi:MAG TPA: glycosyltransferase family 39 protein [Pyrinomonadaceae bacterium]|nr:glycosyltransferase family 39 protein [Pyrinomonadaceae bacterium]